MAKIEVDTSVGYGDVKIVMTIEQFEAIAEFLRTSQYSTPATAAFVEAYEATQKG